MPWIGGKGHGAFLPARVEDLLEGALAAAEGFPPAGSFAEWGPAVRRVLFHSVLSVPGGETGSTRGAPGSAGIPGESFGINHLLNPLRTSPVRCPPGEASPLQRCGAEAL
jgi:hypothetical protein